MDVPFLSSGAVNRQHYALVRGVEESSTPEAADVLLQNAVHDLRTQMDTRAELPLKNLKDNLIVLLYCLTSASSTVVSTKDLEYALPHAITLAEAGKNIRDKRIGYLFCTEVMSPAHELHLMLVNTLRKDLERAELPFICLALDILVQSPTEEVVPAVQSRLYELLSNNSPSIRKRALVAVQALASFARDRIEFLEFFQRKIHKRLLDEDDFVAGSALLASATLYENVEFSHDAIHKRINKLLNQLWSSGSRSRTRTWLTIRVLRALQTAKLAESNIMVFQEIIRLAATSQQSALLRECLLLLSKLDPSQLHSSALGRQTVVYVRDLLTAQNPNDVWLFLETLEAIPAEYWSGSNEDYPAVLEAWEVERVMQLLQSPDSQLRKMTLRILAALDESIVSAYYTQALQSLAPAKMSFHDKNEASRRLLEVADAMCKDDGESYARAIREILHHFQPKLTADSEVLEGAVESVLVHIRNADSSFRIGCATTILTYATDSSLECGATFMVVISAFGCEYIEQVAVRPSELLLCLSSRLASCPIAVQDASLLSMLRISRQCEGVPAEVLSNVSSLAEFSGRHIKRRCVQFSSLSQDKENLGHIVRNAASGSLPDFLDSLYSHKAQSNAAGNSTQESKSTSNKPGPSPESRTLESGQHPLRYIAYEPPAPPSPRVRRGRRLSSTGSSRRSESAYRSPILSPGSLALAGPSDAWKGVSVASPPALDISAQPPALSGARADLITLDSPFLDDPNPGSVPEISSSQLTESLPGDDFEDAWNALDDQSGARGWYAGSMDAMIRLLQGVQYARLNVTPVDRAPFEGELKVRIIPLDTTPKSALLRIRESDEESCLWRMRCSDSGLRLTVKRLLAEE